MNKNNVLQKVFFIARTETMEKMMEMRKAGPTWVNFEGILKPKLNI